MTTSSVCLDITSASLAVLRGGGGSGHRRYRNAPVQAAPTRPGLGGRTANKSRHGSKAELSPGYLAYSPACYRRVSSGSKVMVVVWETPKGSEAYRQPHYCIIVGML